MSSLRNVLGMLLVVTVSTSCIPSNCHAQYGPFADFRAGIDLDADSMFDTGCLFACGTPFAKFGSIKDRITIEPNQNFSGPVKGGGVIVLSGDVDAASGIPVGDWDFNTFYGIDADPTSTDEDMTLTGFDAANSPLNFSEETFIGNTQEYVATSLGAFAIQDLPAEPLFAGFEFSAFVGDPSSIVYAFRATVPISDFDVQLIPEPSSAALLIGASMVFGVARRRRNN